MLPGLDLGALAAIAVCGALAAFAIPAWRTLRMRLRIRQRMRGLILLTAFPEDDRPIPAQEQDDAPGEHALAVLLDRWYPLAGGMGTGLAVLVSGGAAGLLATGALLFFRLPLPFALVGGGMVGVLVGWGVGAVREGGSRIAFADRLLATVDDLQRMVRAGMPVAEAFRTAAAAAADPVRESLRRVDHATGVGVSLAAALDREARRVRISDLAMLAAIFATQSRVGGGIAESVGNLADMLRERKDNRARMKSATAESKLSLIVLSVVPFAAVAIQGVSKPEIFELLLGEARHLLGIGLGLVLLGLACAWMLVRRIRR